MIGTSMVLMYLLTYLNSYDILDHFWFSETRLFMNLIMGSVMTVVMLFGLPQRIHSAHAGGCL